MEQPLRHRVAIRMQQHEPHLCDTIHESMSTPGSIPPFSTPTAHRMCGFVATKGPRQLATNGVETDGYLCAGDAHVVQQLSALCGSAVRPVLQVQHRHWVVACVHPSL